MAVKDISWSDEEIDSLTRMRADGSSISDMATELGKSRSAISGKIRRLGLPAPLIPASTIHKTKRFQPARLARPAIPPSVPVKPTGQPVHFLDVEEQHCRAIVAQADDGYAIFCGEAKHSGSSYCEPHHDLFTQPPQPPRSHRAKEI